MYINDNVRCFAFYEYLYQEVPKEQSSVTQWNIHTPFKEWAFSKWKVWRITALVHLAAKIKYHRLGSL